MIERWLAELEGDLRVHGRRRRRIVEELRDHLRESAELHGPDAALRRMGDPQVVARSFTPRPFDRAYEQRDRLAAVTMLAAMATSLPLAWTLARLGRDAGSHAWIWFMVFLAPTASVALVSCLSVLRRRSLGARLAPLLAGMVVITAAVVIGDIPPARAEFRQYRVAEIGSHHAGCRNAACARATVNDALGACDRDPNCVVNDHAQEIRLNYSVGALALAASYLWAVTGWTPRRRRAQAGGLASA